MKMGRGMNVLFSFFFSSLLFFTRVPQAIVKIETKIRWGYRMGDRR